MPCGSVLDPLKRLKKAAQHMNTSLREVLPYGEGIMGYFNTPRTVQMKTEQSDFNGQWTDPLCKSSRILNLLERLRRSRQ